MSKEIREQIERVKNFGKSLNESKSKIQLGRKYKTRGGWTAFISTFINGNPQGWCKDSFGKEEPYMGTWDENTGKCIKRGDFTQDDITAPYDIIDL